MPLIIFGFNRKTHEKTKLPPTALFFLLLLNRQAKTDRPAPEHDHSCDVPAAPEHANSLRPAPGARPSLLFLLPRPALGARSRPEVVTPWVAAYHSGGARSLGEMEEPPPRFFNDIFPKNHADLAWVPDR
jgi:hypothetical protein